jgi:methylmalonyl-CoA mutase N-terminal domain/subunit
MRDRYGATDPRSMQLRFHTQTAGVSLAAQQPEVNVARVALEALSAALGGTQSLHTDAFDEALALPTENAVRIALRTQQVVAHETGVVHVADPLGGSWYVEHLTDELERGAEAVFAHLGELGHGSLLDGVVLAVEEGWFQSQIAEAAYAFQRKLAAGRWTFVGVNGFTEPDDASATPILYIDPAVEERQLKRLAAVRHSRSDDAVAAALARIVADAATPEVNLMPALIEAARAYVTVGEVTTALESVFGSWDERPHV